MTKPLSIFVWVFAQIGAVSQTFATFLILMGGATAYSRAEAIAVFGNIFPQSCETVSANHGTFSCFSPHPWVFVLCLIALVLGCIFLAFSRIREKGVFSNEATKAVQNMLDSICFRLGLPDVSDELTKKAMAFFLFIAGFAVLLLIGQIPTP